jgi:hypothetical protein
MTPGRWLVAVVAALVLLAGCSQAGVRRAEPAPAATTSTSDQAAAGAEAARGFRSVRGYRATPVPVRVDIPRIGVSSSLGRLGWAPRRDRRGAQGIRGGRLVRARHPTR